MKFHEIRSTFLYESNNRFRMRFMVLRPLPFSAVWKGTAAVQRCHWNWGACSCWTHSRRRVLHKRRDYRNPIGKGNTQQQRSLQTRDSMRLWPSEGENEIFFGWFHGNDAVTSCVRPSIFETTENPEKRTRHLLHSADLWAARAEPEDCSFSWKACWNVFDLQIHQDTAATCPVSGRFLANCPIEASIKLKSVESVESCISRSLESVDFLPFHLPCAPFRFGSGVACCKEPCGYNASSARGLAATTLSRWGDSLGVDPLAQEW